MRKSVVNAQATADAQLARCYGRPFVMPITGHSQVIMEVLADDIARKVEERAFSFDQAFNRVAAEWLGYDLEDDDPRYCDGPGDHGIDFWFAADQSLDVFQCKTHEPHANGTFETSSFGEDGVNDLSRARTLLFSSASPEVDGERLQRLLRAWDDLLRTARETQNDGSDPVLLNLNLVILGNVLTQQAKRAMARLSSIASECAELRGASVQVRAQLVTMDDLIAARWREDNRQWVDSGGHRRNTIDLTPERGASIGDSKGCVFYCRAIDLVSAFDHFGYQIFEPNVRCNIKKSKVNEAIRSSVQHARTRHNFRFLNNGLTVVCTGYTNPNPNRPAFRVAEPGVVNGLQTVVALHEAYHRLSDADKNDFEDNCCVLVRLIKSGTGGDVNAIVRATNTQNPMEPRNLRSNNPEQVLYERLFAELGWFYERKDGAWDAFRNDPSRWRSLPGKRATHFQYTGGGRPRERRVDNEVLAQAWLSFIGLSNQAVHQKRYLFEEDRWYDLVFRQRTLQHAADNSYRPEIGDDKLVREGPSHRMMLAAFLARRFAYSIAPTAKENRDAACLRLGLNPESVSREELDAQLAQNSEYLAGQVISGMSFVFVETLGYMLYRALGNDVHRAGRQLLGNGVLAVLFQTYSIDEARRVVMEEEYEPNDVLAVAWSVFQSIIGEMVEGNWREQYRQARSRTAFNHSTDTRARVRQAVDDVHRLTERTDLLRPWAVGIKPGKGLYGFIRDALGE